MCLISAKESKREHEMFVPVMLTWIDDDNNKSC